ncbi:MAG: DUF72 domain-containing protein [Patescibacteria group bacterium]|nr:DUF72 domain-containing protein [Patescibacteria group bacterium]
MAKLYIGTSGYSYAHWENGVFYPNGLSKQREIEYYAQNFNTVELNYPFYHLPKAKTFSNWRNKVPENFIFAVKASKFITHIKKLKNCQTSWKIFLKRAITLREKLGPFLFQFPSNWKKDPERLKIFLKGLEKAGKKYRYVFEFRHPSWFSEDIYKLLGQYKNTSLCWADSLKWPFVEIVTGSFIYIRMHGSKSLYASDYSKKELKEWSKKIKKCLKQNIDVYVYFNNDTRGYAIKNAKELLGICK